MTYMTFIRHDDVFERCILPTAIMSGFFEHVDFGRSSLWIAIASILFNPIYWNILAQSGMFAT